MNSSKTAASDGTRVMEAILINSIEELSKAYEKQAHVIPNQLPVGLERRNDEPATFRIALHVEITELAYAVLRLIIVQRSPLATTVLIIAAKLISSCLTKSDPNITDSGIKNYSNLCLSNEEHLQVTIEVHYLEKK